MNLKIRPAIVAAEVSLTVFLSRFKRHWTIDTPLDSDDFASCIDYATYLELKNTVNQLRLIEVEHDYQSRQIETIPLSSYLDNDQSKNSFFTLHPSLIGSDEIRNLFISVNTGDVFIRCQNSEMKA
ncbi:MAG: hypothetical protein ACTJIB_12755 [Pseudoalteromonas prydzensis]|uniref:hypothetical protein n=1 Tax=Pseudoalteromonas prydzensis TaxID=182141 RepID=UPI003F9B63C7